MRVREALAAAAARLEPVSRTPRLDAELLMAHALHVSRGELLLRGLDHVAPEGFDALVARRLGFEPIAYITGRRAFWTIELEVGPGVLIPRPDSEALLEAALGHFAGRAPSTVLDLGTGPGTLLLAALDQWPDATGLGVDASATALDFARRNALRLGLSGRAHFRPGDWAEGVDEEFDLILCNPPYVESGAELEPGVARWEPHEALYAGPDGLAVYRRLANALGRLIAPDGCACIEIGQGQEAGVRALFEKQVFAVSTRRDLAGVPRCLVLALNK